MSENTIRTSESIGKFAVAFLAAQKSVENVAKTADNLYFKSKYADLPSVLEEVKKHLHANDIAVLQFPTQPVSDGTLALTTRLLHVSGEWIEGTAVTPLAKSDPQGFGSAVTYLRRYGLQSILGLAAEDDDGESASGRGSAPAPRQRVAAPDEVPGSASGPAKGTAKGFPKAGGPAAKAPARPRGALFPKLGGKKEPIPDGAPPPPTEDEVDSGHEKE